MRFYNRPHRHCGIDLHVKTMSVCILHAAGQVLVHRNVKSTPEAFLEVVAPYRDDLVVSAECMFTWYWLADVCAAEGITFVLGHALAMKAIHGRKSKNDKLDSHKIASLLRGGLLPQSYVYPATMRSTQFPSPFGCHTRPRAGHQARRRVHADVRALEPLVNEVRPFGLLRLHHYACAAPFSRPS
jgi:Transposase